MTASLNIAIFWRGPIHNLWIDPDLLFETQVQVIAALVDGCSIRATEWLTGVYRHAIMRLALCVGEGCAHIHDEKIRALEVSFIET
jgi:hypothetical protein